MKDRDIFMSQASGKQLFYKGYTIRTKLRKQMPPPGTVVATAKASVQKKDLVGKSYEHAKYIDSATYEAGIQDVQSKCKVVLFILLCWSFFTGNKNLDFVWSYLHALQLMGHLALLKIQIPMNVIVMSRSAISLAVLDIREVQSSLLKNSFFDVRAYFSDLLELLETPARLETYKNVESEIAQYQFYELEYREQLSFFDNLRSMRVLLFVVLLFWITIAVLFAVLRAKNVACKEGWLFPAVFRRFYNFMGPNALLRVLVVEFLLVMFAGYVAFDKQYKLIRHGKFKDVAMGAEFTSYIVCLAIPLLVAAAIPTRSKEFLRREPIELSLNTFYYKADLMQRSSKAYPLVLLLQKVIFAMIIFFVEDIVIQLLVMVLVCLAMCWFITGISHIYLDAHLRRFELTNQAAFSVLCILMLLFTDHVYIREMQFNFGYLYSAVLGLYTAYGLILCVVYGLLEPIVTWIRLRNLRLE